MKKLFLAILFLGVAMVSCTDDTDLQEQESVQAKQITNLEAGTSAPPKPPTQY